ncbi:PTS sugar transporter subunit IIA [Candidatus Protochlamydia amoebophila]|uniref:Nitrogen regulatory protein n=1 Tax=Candidatus Protochlamydia amoebophila TaxID=362787 RepID=A0A0C1JTG0_9BACT|nr:PTS sugar transporter subunit IIA [Candidatus Protochlamydia amoebophila]KIC73741.1 Nitrogen regulatory protein [Candidatus Protochlamydia amoebophila]
MTQDLKIRDVADLLNVSETTIRRWVSDRKIPSYSINKHHYFSRTEIENWVISHKFDKNQSSSPFTQSIKTTVAEKKTATGGSKQFSLFRAIHKGDVLYNVSGKTKEEIIRKTMKKTAKDLNVDAEVMTELLLDRENMMPTALNNGIAIPHTRDSLHAQHDAIVVVFLDKPLEYGALDGKPVNTLFFLFAADDKRHLHLLAKIAHLSSQPKALEFFKTKPSKDKLLAFIKDWESQISQIV